MAILTALLNTLVVIICLFLICLILIQRGKGGGLAGALGGVGGSSAFGTKAGDIFTRVTVVVAAVWIFLSLILVVLYNNNRSSAWGESGSSALSKEIAPKSSASKSKTGADAVIPPVTGPASSPGTAPAAAPTAVPAIPDATPPKTAK